MNKAHFQVLGLTVPSRPFIYHDEGYVKSISDEHTRVNILHDFAPDYRKKNYSFYLGLTCKRDFHIHIFYLDQRSKRGNIRLRAHEETHALEDIDGLFYLTDALRQHQNVKLNLENIDELEVRAELGALYALHARGLSPWGWGLINDSFFDSDFRKAKKLYNQSKQSKKRFFG